jgi:hypothetical protein
VSDLPFTCRNLPPPYEFDPDAPVSVDVHLGSTNGMHGRLDPISICHQLPSDG